MPLPRQLNPENINGTNGFLVTSPDDAYAFNTSDVGDINGGGLDDILLDKDYVVFESRDRTSRTINLANLSESDGFAITGANDAVVSSLVSESGEALDVNNDGVGDFAVGNAVVFSSRNGFSTSLNVRNLSGDEGFTLSGNRLASLRVAGDVNGNRTPDFTVTFSRNRRAIVYGESNNGPTQPPIQPPTPPTPTDEITGTGGPDLLRGTDRADTIRGFEGEDRLLGLRGNDLIRGGVGKDRLSGGAGRDTFVINASGGADTILDFRSEDFIGLSGGLRERNLTFSGNKILLGETGKTLATLSGFNTATLSSSQFVLL
ncbi:MAG: hypothetical protein AAFY72_05105 [Cyanobacteria bacterium J06649_4]